MLLQASSFCPSKPTSLLGAINRAIALYRDRKAWQLMQKRGMRSDVSWQKSAGRYAALYKTLTR